MTTKSYMNNYCGPVAALAGADETGNDKTLPLLSCFSAWRNSNLSLLDKLSAVTSEMSLRPLLPEDSWRPSFSTSILFIKGVFMNQALYSLA